MNIGKGFLKLRNMAKLSQQDMADKMGVTVSWLSQIETNKKKPTSKVIKKFADALDIPVSGVVFEFMEIHDVKPGTEDIFRKAKPIMEDLIKIILE